MYPNKDVQYIGCPVTPTLTPWCSYGTRHESSALTTSAGTICKGPCGAFAKFHPEIKPNP